MVPRDGWAFSYQDRGARCIGQPGSGQQRWHRGRQSLASAVEDDGAIDNLCTPDYTPSWTTTQLSNRQVQKVIVQVRLKSRTSAVPPWRRPLPIPTSPPTVVDSFLDRTVARTMGAPHQEAVEVEDEDGEPEPEGQKGRGRGEATEELAPRSRSAVQAAGSTERRWVALGRALEEAQAAEAKKKDSKPQ